MRFFFHSLIHSMRISHMVQYTIDNNDEQKCQTAQNYTNGVGEMRSVELRMENNNSKLKAQR